MFADADLEKVDWNSLGRPYSEQHIPELLRNLRDRASGGREAYQETLSELLNEINHQGTVYEVAAYAIPFLMDLIRGNVTGNRVDIVVDLLLWFGELGNDTLYKETHPAQDVTGINPFTRQPMIIRAIDDRPAAKKVREVLRARSGVYLALLAHSDGSVRSAAANALAPLS